MCDGVGSKPISNAIFITGKTKVNKIPLYQKFKTSLPITVEWKLISKLAAVKSHGLSKLPMHN